jgi:hypothetical protein
MYGLLQHHPSQCGCNLILFFVQEIVQNTVQPTARALCPYTLFNPSLVSIHESCIKIENFCLCWSMNTSLFLWINAHCTCNKLAVSISTCVKVFRNSTCILETMEGKLQHVTEFMSVWNLVGYSLSTYCNRVKVKLFYWKRFSSMDFLIHKYIPCTCMSHSMNRNTQGYKKAKII